MVELEAAGALAGQPPVANASGVAEEDATPEVGRDGRASGWGDGCVATEPYHGSESSSADSAAVMPGCASAGNDHSGVVTRSMRIRE